MRQCSACRVALKGDWVNCPLCGTPVDLKASIEPSSIPDVPLKYNRRRMTRILTLISLVIILLTFVLGLWWRGDGQLLQAGTFGVMTMWLVVLTVIRKRRNLAKSMVYLLVILSLICVYLDWLMGWQAWSLTYAIPIICTTSVISIFIVSQFTRTPTGDYILYLATADLIGLVPIVFIVFGWVTTTWPAWLSIGVSAVMLVLMFIIRGPIIWNELKKRFFI